MPRKGENIYKRKDGRWEGRYIKSHNGAKALYGYIYGRSYQEVKEKLIEVKADYQQNKSREIKMPLPFSTYSGLWLSEKEQTIKHSTYIK